MTTLVIILYARESTSGIVGHSIQSPHATVVFDTDMALDDARALVLLAQTTGINIAAIVTSDGACRPTVGARNARALLHAVGKPSIPLGSGRVISSTGPPWRAMSESLGWTYLATDDTAVVPDAESVLEAALRQQDGPITYLCLGSFSNLADILRGQPDLVRSCVHRVYFSGRLDTIYTSWNAARDTSSARYVERSGLEIRCVDSDDSLTLPFDTLLLQPIRMCPTTACHLITQLHADPRVDALVRANHFRCWDESVVLCLIDSSLTRFTPSFHLEHVLATTGFDRPRARQLYVDCLKEERPMPSAHLTTVIASHTFSDPTALTSDVAEIVTEVLSRYGEEEWRAVVLTAEMHRHLGIYAVIGAKMGVRAVEVLSDHEGDLAIVSRAGRVPPISCMNDGLQVATGASLGHGTIQVDDSIVGVEADFTKGNHVLTLSLRQEIARQMSADIDELRSRCGDLTAAYWADLRRLAIHYWQDLDRRQIFSEFMR